MCIVLYLQPRLVHDLSVRIINAIVIDQCFVGWLCHSQSVAILESTWYIKAEKL